MFNDNSFENWLDKQAEVARKKITSQQTLESSDILVLVLKAQTNHIHHLSESLHEEIVTLSKDMDRRFERVDKHLEQVDRRLDQTDKHLEQVDKRLEQVDKHLERLDKRIDQVEKRIDQVDKRIEQVERRIDQVDKRIDQVDKNLERIDMHLEHSEKNFERIDKRFEESNRRFEQMQQQNQQQFQMTIARTDSLMKWSIGTTLFVGALIIAAMRLFGVG